MSYPVRCPHCKVVFKVHGYEASMTCNDCGGWFNPQCHGIHHLERDDAEVSQ
jgi:uncharacterized CHY-type Zn-finger protein